MRKIAIMNQKGGCGKTTVAINLCGALTQLDRRVLLVDLDPQGHATIGLGVDSEQQQVTTYELLLDSTVTASDAILETRDRLYLMPASTVLSGIEQELHDVDGREARLTEKVEQFPDDAFDFLIVDCPPSVGLLTFNALVAVDEVVIPVDASSFSMHGLGKLRETLEVVEEELNHHFKVHVVCNNIDTRTHFSNEMLDQVEKFHSGVLLDTYIINSVKLKEAAAQGKTIFELAARSKPAGQFLSLARELIEKEPRIETKNLEAWMERLHGPRRVPEGVLFALEAPNADSVRVTGEFTNWSREGRTMDRDSEDGLWKLVVDIPPGEYEYRFIVDGVWIRDPNNKDYIRNEFGQENSLLIV